MSVQGPTGNGVDTHVGPLLVQDLTLVASTDGRRASLIFSIVNEGGEPDFLTTATVKGGTATIRTAPIAVEARSAVKVGGDSPSQVLVAGMTVPTGDYTDVTLTFRVAGTVTASVPVVPGEGYYAPYAPGAAASPSR